MRNKSILMLIAIIAMMGAIQSEAAEAKIKKLKYLEHQYLGEVIKKIPMGEGKITIAGIDITGTFEDKTIKNASLDCNWCAFEGDITYDETDTIVLKAGGHFKYYYYVCDYRPKLDRAEFDKPLNLDELGERREEPLTLSKDMKITSVPLKENLIKYSNSTNYYFNISDTIDVSYIPEEFRDFNCLPYKYKFQVVFRDVTLYKMWLPYGARVPEEKEVAKTGFFWADKEYINRNKKEVEQKKWFFKDKAGKDWTIQVASLHYKVVFPDGSIASTGTNDKIIKKGENYYNKDSYYRIRVFPNGVYLEYDGRKYTWHIPDEGVQFGILHNTDIFNEKEIIIGKDSILRFSEWKYSNRPHTSIWTLFIDGYKKKSPDERMEIIRKYILPLLQTENMEYEFDLIKEDGAYSKYEKEDIIYCMEGNLLSYTDGEKRKSEIVEQEDKEREQARREREAAISAEIAKFKKKFGFDPTNVDPKWLFKPGRSFAAIEEWLEWNDRSRIKLSIDHGNSKCYDFSSYWYRGYFWVTNGVVTSVVWHEN